jgi:AraC-like DNA-binding protein
MRRWLRETGVDPQPFFDRVGLGWLPDDQPLLAIPLRSAVELLVEIARAEGPDVPLRIAETHGIYEIGPIGALGLAGPTVRAGLHNIATNMPRHCTHEIFTVEDYDGFIRVGDGWAMNVGDLEARHLVQQYVAALVHGICRASGPVSPNQFRVALSPHPVAGSSHLESWLGESLRLAAEGPLRIEIANELADRLIPERIRTQASARVGPTWERLRYGESLADSIATLVAHMLPFAVPSIDYVAHAAGVSTRTLRRRLKEEGTTLSDIVDRTRAQIAVNRITSRQRGTLQDVAEELGYSHQAALTRAVKRWTGQTPRIVRSKDCG